MRPDEAWLERFAQVTRKHVLEFYPPDSCIATCRIGAKVLRHFGVLVRPVPVRAMAFTPDRWALHERGMALDDPRLAATGHCVLIGHTGEVYESAEEGGRRRWNGHLVLLTHEPAILVDMSLDQASRPDRGIALTEPICARIPNAQAFRDGEPVLGRTREGVVLAYIALHNDGWKTKPKEPPEVAEAVAERISEELAG